MCPGRAQSALPGLQVVVATALARAGGWLGGGGDSCCPKRSPPNETATKLIKPILMALILFSFIDPSLLQCYARFSPTIRPAGSHSSQGSAYRAGRGQWVPSFPQDQAHAGFAAGSAMTDREFDRSIRREPEPVTTPEKIFALKAHPLQPTSRGTVSSCRYNGAVHGSLTIEYQSAPGGARFRFPAGGTCSASVFVVKSKISQTNPRRE
jgi:hypothetical protein